MKTYIGIDNGVSGTIGIINEKVSLCYSFQTPIIKQQDYTKAKKIVSRIESRELVKQLKAVIPNLKNSFTLVERPMVNPKRFAATASALRAHEAIITVLELLGMPYQFIDSKEWQKKMLPDGLKGSSEQKKASKDIGLRLFPQFSELIEKHGDADGILMAEYAKRTY